MDDDINILALIKGKERYVWMYDDNRVDELLCCVARFACDESLSLTLHDANVLENRVQRPKRFTKL